MSQGKPQFKRVLLKISGEALQGKSEFGIDPAVIDSIAAQMKEIHDDGVEIAVVVGGGNIFRGIQESAKGMDRATADYMGMLATIMNALAIQDALERKGLQSRVLSAIELKQLAEPYIRRRAVRHLEKGRIVVLGGGTGNPYFTTDTTAALRAVEVNADIILKATKVDGVYDKDPMLHKDAKKFDQLSYLDVIRKGLKVMDSTAITLCMDNKLPILVFNLTSEGNIRRVIHGEKIGTVVKDIED